MPQSTHFTISIICAIFLGCNNARAIRSDTPSATTLQQRRESRQTFGVEGVSSGDGSDDSLIQEDSDQQKLAKQSKVGKTSGRTSIANSKATGGLASTNAGDTLPQGSKHWPKAPVALEKNSPSDKSGGGKAGKASTKKGKGASLDLHGGVEQQAAAVGEQQEAEGQAHASAVAFGVVVGMVLVATFVGIMLYTSRPYRIYGETTQLVEAECSNLYDADALYDEEIYGAI